jgi:hypothetical protein
MTTRGFVDVAPAGSGWKPLRRRTLSEADVVDFIKRAAADPRAVPGIAEYTWWPARSRDTTAVSVDRGDGVRLSIKIRELIAGEDGVFFYGWDEASRNAVWKWVPAEVPEKRENLMARMGVFYPYLVGRPWRES